MPTQKQFSCLLIGEGTLPIQCAELLLERGHQILGIISPDGLIGDWAKEKGISHIRPTDNLLAFLNRQPFDYLFRIVNNSVLPKKILELPRQGAINYHDAPLPKYAGVNATSWALMQQEKTHGVSWHRMSEVIDGGDILKQVSLDIAKGETAFTLYGKCYEAAIHSFAQLIDEISLGKAVATPQNLNDRTYFSPSKRPSAGGLLSFNRCAYELDALVRALDFGPYPNPLGLAKLAIERDFIVVSQLEVLDEFSQASPGTITGIETDFLKVSTSSYEVALRQVQTLEGEALSIPDFVENFALQVGYRFQDIEPDLAKSIENFNSLIAKHEAFWVERLASLQPLAIPYAERTASHLKQKRFESVKMPVPDEVISFWRECHPDWNLGDFLLAVFVGYLARIGGTDDFDIGFRDVELARELNGSTGFFAAYVPCHLEINLEQSFEEFFETVREQVALTKQHKTYARDAVVRYPELRSVPELGSEQIFPVVIERVEKLDDHQASPGNEFTFIISEDGKECGWFYNAEALDGDSIARMVEQFTIFLQGIVTDSSQHLAYLPLLSEEERHKILVEWNDTKADYPLDKCIHQLFEEQVERTPDHVAVVFEDQQLTYRELNVRANQLAHYLQKLGVGPEVLVGICVERSLEMIVGLLGILKSGGGYVPLDPNYPKSRVAFMLEDSQAPVLLTQERLRETFRENIAQVVCLDTDWKILSQEDENNLVSGVTSEELVYVIYTSGSTGQPKGVMISHRSLCNHMLWKQSAYRLTKEDRVLHTSSISFDISVWELFGPLLVGARLIIGELMKPQDLAYLVRIIAEQKITILKFMPSMLQVFLEEQGIDSCKCVRLVRTGIEALSVELQEKFFDQFDAELLTGYGLTEATIGVIYSNCQRVSNRRIVPIGRPIANTQIYLLDQHLQPNPIGVASEIYIGGECLARGYLNRPDLTAEKFIPNPFITKPGKRLYRTGDLGRYLSSGDIEFLGRIDNQVKIRGFRIELEEIESILSQHPQVREAAVIAREDQAGNKCLVAYLVPKQEPVSLSKLRQFLAQKLPEYMLPSAFVFLEAMPLTPNGKLNRCALPSPDSSGRSLEKSLVAPRTPTEEILVAIWAEVLGIQKIGIHDNFFELGGHSLLATQVISRLRKAFKVELPLHSLFETPTVADFAETLIKKEINPGLVRKIAQLLKKLNSIEKKDLLALLLEEEGVNVSHTGVITPRKDVDLLPLSFAQQWVWFFEEFNTNTPIYNTPKALSLMGKLNVAALEQSLREIVRRHEILRTTFQVVNGQPFQLISPEITLSFPVVDFRKFPEAEQRVVQAQKWAVKDAQHPFDLARGPLLRVKLLRLAEEFHLLLFNIHHILFDGWSFSVFFRELTTLYEAFSTDQPSPLPELPIQYADFAVWQRHWLEGDVLESQLSYWKQQLSGTLPVLHIPTDRPRAPVQSYRGTCQSLTLSKSLTETLKILSYQEGVTLFMTLLAAFKILLHRYSRQEEIIVGTPIAGRNQVETEALIGCFLNILVLRTDLSGNPSFRELLGRLREVVLGAYAHQDFPFKKLVEELHPSRDLIRTPLFQVLFILQNTPKFQLDLPGLIINSTTIHTSTAKFDLTLALAETGQGIIGALEYNTDLFNATTITQMLEDFSILLERIVTNPNHRLSDLFLGETQKKEK